MHPVPSTQDTSLGPRTAIVTDPAYRTPVTDLTDDGTECSLTLTSGI